MFDILSIVLGSICLVVWCVIELSRRRRSVTTTMMMCSAFSNEGEISFRTVNVRKRQIDQLQTLQTLFPIWWMVFFHTVRCSMNALLRRFDSEFGISVYNSRSSRTLYLYLDEIVLSKWWVLHFWLRLSIYIYIVYKNTISMCVVARRIEKEM